MPSMLRDIRYAVRRLGARPGFTAVAVISLALGIGANTAVFTLLDDLLFADPGFEDVDSLVEIYPAEGGRVGLNALSYPELDDVREGTEEVFSGVAATSLTLVQWDPRVPGEHESESLAAEIVSGDYFDLLGLEPALGRGFLPEEDRVPDAHPVVVISQGLWKRAFGADPDALGETLRLNGRPYTVVGVARPDMHTVIPGIATDVWAPSMMVNHLNGFGGDMLESRGSHNLFAKGRLRPGVSLAQAQDALDRVTARTHEEHSEYADDWSLLGVPTADVGIHPLFDRVLYPASAVLLAVVAMVLLIACVNLVSFLLAQAADRRKEISLRLALGAGRRSLIRQLLTETVLISLAGGVLGIALAVWGLQVMAEVKPPVAVPMDLSVFPDAGVLGASLALALVAGLLFGLLPALRSTRPDLTTALKSDGLADGSERMGRRWGLRGALVVGQVAVSLCLLTGSGLFLRSLQAAQSVDPGFGHEPTAIVTLGLLPSRHDEESATRTLERLTDEAEILPGVRAVGIVDNLALGGTSFNGRTVNVDGVEPPPGRDGHLIDAVVVDGDYFDAAGVPLVAGRTFDPRDEPNAQPVVIVSQAMAERFWPGESALGREVVHTEGTRWRVVGVARDTKVRTIGEAPTPYLYLPLSQNPRYQVQVLARTAADPHGIARRIGELARRLDPEVQVIETKTVEEHLGFMLFPFRFGGTLLSILGALALVLATIGLYGVVSYAVASRRREVGIRMSLGARASEMVTLMMTGGLRLVAIGAALGLGLAFLAASALDSLLFGVDPHDPATYAGVTLILALVAAAASLAPALRASRVDPVETLRRE
jgi:predicted permease